MAAAYTRHLARHRRRRQRLLIAGVLLLLLLLLLLASPQPNQSAVLFPFYGSTNSSTASSIRGEKAEAKGEKQWARRSSNPNPWLLPLLVFVLVFMCFDRWLI
jgi:hypothetical protein